MPQLSGSLRRAAGQGDNLEDSGPIVSPPAGSAAFTQGATLIDQIATQPTLARPWTLLGWSITVNLLLFQTQVGRTFGRLGKLYAGIFLTPFTPTQSSITATTPFVVGIQEFPQDKTNLQVIFDGTTDPAPPFWSGVAPVPSNPVGGVFQFALPQKLGGGDQLGIGLWLTPSLITNTAILIVHGATFTINYE